jgi:hypothetical protein
LHASPQTSVAPEIWAGSANGTVVFSSPQPPGCIPNVATTSKTFSALDVRLQVSGSLLTPGSFTATLTATTISSPTPGVQVTCYDSQGNITGSFVVLANAGGSETGSFTINGTSDGQAVTANFINVLNGSFGTITGTIQNTVPPQLLLKIMTNDPGTMVVSDNGTATLTLQQDLSIGLTLDPNPTPPSFSIDPNNIQEVTVTATVWDAANKKPVPDFGVAFQEPQAVDLQVSGHQHPIDQNTDVGTFFHLDATPFISTPNCTTDVLGSCSLIYVVSNTSGKYTITAGSLDPSIPATNGTADLTILVDGLKPLPALLGPLVGSYRLTGANTKHPLNHYGTPYTNFAVDEWASSYQLFTGYSLGINDMSLAWGGLFDIDGNWLEPHILHRTGNSVDIDGQTLSSSGQSAVTKRLLLDGLARFWGFRRICEGKKVLYPLPVCLGGRIHYEYGLY